MSEVNFSRSIDLETQGVKTKKNVIRPQFKRPEPRVKTYDEVKAQVNDAIKNAGGKYVKFDDVDHSEGLLIAGVISNNKNKQSNDNIKFAILNRDRKITYIHNNEHFSVLREIPSSLFVLNYLYQNEPVTLLNIAVDTFEKDDMDVYTKICIHIPKKPIVKDNKNKKKQKKVKKG